MHAGASSSILCSCVSMAHGMGSTHADCTCGVLSMHCNIVQGQALNPDNRCEVALSITMEEPKLLSTHSTSRSEARSCIPVRRPAKSEAHVSLQSLHRFHCTYQHHMHGSHRAATHSHGNATSCHPKLFTHIPSTLSMQASTVLNRLAHQSIHMHVLQTCI